MYEDMSEFYWWGSKNAVYQEVIVANQINLFQTLGAIIL